MSDLPIPKSRIVVKKYNTEYTSYNGILGENIMSNIYFSNSSTNNLLFGYGNFVEVFIEKGVVNQSNSGYIGLWTYNYDINNNPIAGTGKWVDSNNSTLSKHPFDNSGISLPTDPNSTGLMKEYRWYIYDGGYSSYNSDQPEYLLESFNIKLDQTDGAIINNNYKIKCKPWFRYGKDVLNNPLQDFPISGTITEINLTASLIRILKTTNLSESETVSGPNFPFKYELKVDISAGKTITNLNIVDEISDYLLLYDPDINDNESDLGSVYDSTKKSSISKNTIDSRKNITIPPLRSERKQNISWAFPSNIVGLGG